MDRFAKALIGFGIVISLWVWLFESSSAFQWETPKDFLADLAFELMLIAPWIVLLILNIKNINTAGVVISAIPMALFEVVAYNTTFINPQGSTSALIYAVKPFYQVLIIAIGLLIGYVVSNSNDNA